MGHGGGRAEDGGVRAGKKGGGRRGEGGRKPWRRPHADLEGAARMPLFAWLSRAVLPLVKSGITARFAGTPTGSLFCVIITRSSRLGSFVSFSQLAPRGFILWPRYATASAPVRSRGACTGHTFEKWKMASWRQSLSGICVTLGAMTPFWRPDAICRVELLPKTRERKLVGGGSGTGPRPGALVAPKETFAVPGPRAFRPLSRGREAPSQKPNRERGSWSIQ